MNERTSLVTVYITNHNYGQYIEQSIKSVLNQTISDYEVLIIDDGSTDDSREVIESFRNHEKIKIIFQQNKGLNATNNIAIRAASGKYIMRLDADDFIHHEALEHMTAVLESDDELGLVFPDYYYVDKEGNITGEEKRHNFARDVTLFDQPAHGACTMIRLDFVKALGGYNESFHCQDGYDLWLKFIMHYKVTNINKPLFYYRKHGNNLTNNEQRILTTRKRIKDYHVNTNRLVTHTTMVVIPVRTKMIGNVIWPFYKLPNGDTVLKSLVRKASSSQKISKVVVTASDLKVREELNNIMEEHSDVLFVERPAEFERFNEPLNRTYNLILEQTQHEFNTEAIMSVSVDYPFFNEDAIEDALNTLVLFNADAILSVRPDNKMYYQHTGSGLKPVLDQEKFTKLEREALFKGAGGLVLSTLNNFKKHQKLVAGKVGNVVVDERAAFGVFNEFELKVFEALLKKEDVEAE